jgi:S-adenosyl methyltransferase
MTQANGVPAGVDSNIASPARMYNYILGGQHNFPVDRAAVERLRARMPELADAAWANRGFHGRAAVWMAERGIRQFLDIGSGLPMQNNTHQAVQRIVPAARVVYVDIDPMLGTLAGELCAGNGTTAVIQADLGDPDSVLDNPGLRALIDFTEPVGLLMTAVLQFVADDRDPWMLSARYTSAVAPGSYLALSHATPDRLPPVLVQSGIEAYAQSAYPLHPRRRAEVARFFDGLDLVPPWRGAAAALTYPGSWGAEDPEAADSDGSRAFYCGVARRP